MRQEVYSATRFNSHERGMILLWSLCLTALQHRAAGAKATLLHAGANLSDMPMEILQAIASRFHAAEWARGPARTCRTLNRLPLPCITMKVRLSQLGCLPHYPLPHCTPVLCVPCTHGFDTLAERYVCLLQLKKVRFANDYDRAFISWAVPRLRPDNGHLRWKGYVAGFLYGKQAMATKP